MMPSILSKWTPPQFDSAKEIRDHLDERQWQVAMEDIARRHDLSPEGLAPFSSGSDVVWGTPTAVFKLTAPRWSAQMANEVAFLRHVHGALSVQTPQVLATGALEGWPYLVMDRVRGVAVGDVWAQTSFEHRRAFATQLGRLTAELHRLPAPAGVVDDWREFWNTCRNAAVTRNSRGRVEGAPSARLFDEIAKFLDANAPLQPRALGVLHTELLDQHVFVEVGEDRALKISSLIDFADSRYGAVDYDFAAPVEFIFKGEPGLFGAFLRGSGIAASDLDDNASQRALAWALCHQFSSLARMLNAIEGPVPTSLSALASRLFGVGET